MRPFPAKRTAPGRWIGAAVGAALLLAGAGSANAVTVEDYQKWRLLDRTWRTTPTGVLEIRLLGVFRGLVLANRVLRKRGATPLFCPERGTQLTGRMLRKWVDDELKSPTGREGRPYDPRTEIEAVVLLVVARKWPCEGSSVPEAPEPPKATPTPDRSPD